MTLTHIAGGPCHMEHSHTCVLGQDNATPEAEDLAMVSDMQCDV